MREQIENYRAAIRDTLRETVGRGRAVSLLEAANLTGLIPNTIYQMSDGQMKSPERHLHLLLEIPAFTEAYMARRGYACAHVGNHSGCAYEAIGSFMEATGEAGRVVADRKITDPERKRLVDVFKSASAKAIAFIHRFHRERMERAGA